MNLSLPSFTTIANLVGDTLQENSYSHCNILCPSSNNPNVILNMDGSVFTAYEVIGTQRYLTPETEFDHIQAVQHLVEATLRNPHHKLGIMYVRDPNRTRPQLDEIFRPTIDTIRRLDMEAEHFFESQKNDLEKNCSFEKVLLIITTTQGAAKDSANNDEYALADRPIVVSDTPMLAQDPSRESQDIMQEHQAFLNDLGGKLKKYLGLVELSSEQYFKCLKEEEDLISLNRTRWESKHLDTPIDLTLNYNESDFVTHPPYAYQIVTDDKQFQDKITNIVRSGDYYLSSLDREYMNIDPNVTFQDLFKNIDSRLPFRAYFELETGTDAITRELSARQTYLVLFKVSVRGRRIDRAIRNLLFEARDNHRTLLKGTMSIATWATNIEDVKSQKRDLKQALLSWGSPTVRTPSSLSKGYFSTLPSFAKKQSARPCVQLDDRHLRTLPITRPATPNRSGAICLSSSDGKLYPINVASSEQDYSVNAIIGAMKSGKTVFAATLNNSILLAEGNADLPLMSYLDFGSGVVNYIRSVKSWLPKHHHHKLECVVMRNEEGNATNILEPQFGLSRLESQEREFAIQFLSRIINGESEKSVSGQLGSILARLINAFLDEKQANPLTYEKRIGFYVKEELTLHREINALLNDGTIKILPSERNAWYTIRDKLFQLDKEKYFAHARFAHRQGSGDLRDFVSFMRQSPVVQESLSGIAVEIGGNTALCDYIITALESTIMRFDSILGRKSQIDISQAKVIGIDAKPILREVNEPAMRMAFALLAKQLGSRNFWRDPNTFMSYVPDIYQEHYKEVLASEANIRKHDFTDEYAQFKSKELDSILNNSVFIARKYNLCITVAAQLAEHIPEQFLSLASNVFVMSASPKCSDILQGIFKLSNSLKSEMARKLKHSDGFGRLLLYIGKFDKFEGYVVQMLRNQITPSYLWNFSSDENDETIKALARMKYGERSAFQRLAKAYPNGSIVQEIERLISDTTLSDTPLTTKDAINSILESLRYAA